MIAAMAAIEGLASGLGTLLLSGQTPRVQPYASWIARTVSIVSASFADLSGR